MNNYDLAAHRDLATAVTKLHQPWIVTYDYAAVDAGLYAKQRRMVYGLSYSAQNRYKGCEVLFVADGLNLPNEWQRSGRILLSRPDSKHPVYGKMHNMKSHAEMEEGPAAFERFRTAMKTIVSVKKRDVIPDRQKPHTKKKKPASRKG